MPGSNENILHALEAIIGHAETNAEDAEETKERRRRLKS
jgi:hypothetical protein